jgi:hypothetical protein
LAVARLATAAFNVVAAFNGVVIEAAATPEAGRVLFALAKTLQT